MSKEMVRALQANGLETTFCELKSEYGHDAFLLDDDALREMVAGFLAHNLRCERREAPQTP
jgi:homoserine O-acetyltransferase